MARIRTIKPEFWTSVQVMECSMNARLLFIGIWNFCDDDGRHPCNAKQIKALVFPGDDVPIENVSRMLDELSANGLIVRYSVENKEYLEVTGWHHQKIDRPQPAKYPPPPILFVDHSTSDERQVATERKGKEGKGKDNAAADAAHQPVLIDLPPQQPISDEADLFRRGKVVFGASSGGLVKKLLDAKGGNIAAARAVVETAATKGDAREYLGSILRPRDQLAEKEAARMRGDVW